MNIYIYICMYTYVYVYQGVESLASLSLPLIFGFAIQGRMYIFFCGFSGIIAVII